MRTVLIASALLAGVVTIAGCSSSDDSNDKSAASATNGCAADNRKDIYTAGLTKAAGNLTIKMVDAAPAPPSKGMNTMTLEVTDASGKPVDGATVTITPFMPDHGHGSARTPVVTPAGGGKYTASEVYFAMAGLWRVTVSVQMPSAPVQEAIYQFCLDG
jgi:hypothetical protein